MKSVTLVQMLRTLKELPDGGSQLFILLATGQLASLEDGLEW